MNNVILNAVFGPRYEIVIQDVTVGVNNNFDLTLQRSEPLRINVGTGFNNLNQTSTGTLDVTIIAAEVVNAYRAIGYDGLFTQLTQDSLSNYAGVTRMATIIGDPVDVVRVGLMEEPTWGWIPNAPIFISTNGVLTQSLPTGFVRRIGWAISATKINLDPYPIITGV